MTGMELITTRLRRENRSPAGRSLMRLSSAYMTSELWRRRLERGRSFVRPFLRLVEVRLRPAVVFAVGPAPVTAPRISDRVARSRARAHSTAVNRWFSAAMLLRWKQRSRCADTAPPPPSTWIYDASWVDVNARLSLSLCLPFTAVIRSAVNERLQTVFLPCLHGTCALREHVIPRNAAYINVWRVNVAVILFSEAWVGYLSILCRPSARVGQ